MFQVQGENRVAVAGIENAAVEWWQQPESRPGTAAGEHSEGAAATIWSAPSTLTADYTPVALPRRYAFLYGDEHVYRALLHQSIASADETHGAVGSKRGFACWVARVAGVPGHVFALTAAQFSRLDRLFPSDVARNSVLATISPACNSSSSSSSQGALDAIQQPLACSTWISAPFVAEAPKHRAATSEKVLDLSGVDGPVPGSKRSLFVTSIGSVTDVDMEEQQADNSSGIDAALPSNDARASLRDSFGSDLRLSFGSDWQSSLPDLDLLPDMPDQMPISAVATASASRTKAAKDSSTSVECNSKPVKERSYPTKMKKTQALSEQSAAKAAATAARHAAEVQTVGLLPRGPDGRPKPSPPWIAAAVYWAASSDHAPLTRATGISVTKLAVDSPAEFRIVTLGHATKQAYGREADIDSGVALTRFVLEVMKLAGSNVRLPGWDSMRKHLSPVWWTNPSRGGNKSRDFSQVYVERVPGSFAAQCAELRRVHPVMMEAALSAWEEWYLVAAAEKRGAATAVYTHAKSGRDLDAATSSVPATGAVD